MASAVSNSVWPHRQQPTRLPLPWDSPGKITGVGCHFLLQCMKVKSESKVVESCPTPRTPWTAAYQAPPSMGFARQEYWSGLPLPTLSRDTTCFYLGTDLHLHTHTYAQVPQRYPFILLCLHTHGTCAPLIVQAHMCSAALWLFRHLFMEQHVHCQ